MRIHGNEEDVYQTMLAISLETAVLIGIRMGFYN
jgi:hypothetical protein